MRARQVLLQVRHAVTIEVQRRIRRTILVEAILVFPAVRHPIAVGINGTGTVRCRDSRDPVHRIIRVTAGTHALERHAEAIGIDRPRTTILINDFLDQNIGDRACIVPRRLRRVRPRELHAFGAVVQFAAVGTHEEKVGPVPRPESCKRRQVCHRIKADHNHAAASRNGMRAVETEVHGIAQAPAIRRIDRIEERDGAGAGIPQFDEFIH